MSKPLSKTAIGFAAAGILSAIVMIFHAFVRPLPESVTAPAATVTITAVIVVLLDVLRTRIKPGQEPPGFPHSWSNQSTYVIAIWEDHRPVREAWSWPATPTDVTRWIGVFHRTSRKCVVVCPCPSLWVREVNQLARLQDLARAMGFRVVGAPRHGFSPADGVELDVEAEVRVDPPAPGELMPTEPAAFPPTWVDGRPYAGEPADV
jgi:hypothetical protein